MKRLHISVASFEVHNTSENRRNQREAAQIIRQRPSKRPSTDDKRLHSFSNTSSGAKGIIACMKPFGLSIAGFRSSKKRSISRHPHPSATPKPLSKQTRKSRYSEVSRAANILPSGLMVETTEHTWLRTWNHSKRRARPTPALLHTASLKIFCTTMKPAASYPSASGFQGGEASLPGGFSVCPLSRVCSRFLMHRLQLPANLCISHNAF